MEHCNCRKQSTKTPIIGFGKSWVVTNVGDVSAVIWLISRWRRRVWSSLMSPLALSQVVRWCCPTYAECEEETECIKHKAGFSCLSCRAFLRRIIVRRSRARRSTASPEKEQEQEQDLLSYIKFSHDNFLFQAGLKLLLKYCCNDVFLWNLSRWQTHSTQCWPRPLSSARVSRLGTSWRPPLTSPLRSDWQPAWSVTDNVSICSPWCWFSGMVDEASLQISQSKLILPITVPGDSGQSAEEEPAPDNTRGPRHVLQSGAAVLQVGLLTWRPHLASPVQTEAQVQSGDQQRSGQQPPGGHCHQLHLRGQENISKYYSGILKYNDQAVTKLARLPRFALVLLVLISVFTTEEPELARVEEQKCGYLNILQRSVREHRDLEELSAHLPGLLEKLGEGCRYLRAENAPGSPKSAVS